MDEQQFAILMEKLEEIRCGLIDVENALEPKPETFAEGLERLRSRKGVSGSRKSYG